MYSPSPPSPTLTDLLTHLMRLPTVTGDHPANLAAQDWIAEQLQGLPLDIKRYANKGFPSLVATTPQVSGGKHPRLWLAGHLDVVPASIKDFSPVVEEGRLIGRGAFDMKYAIACFINLLQELGPDLSKYSLGLMLTSDEELGGTDGVEWLIEEQGYRGEAVLLPECGTNWTIETGSKGKTVWKLRSRGHASHASRPWSGTNAIDQLTAFVAELKTHVPTEPCGHEEHAHCTINLGQITGGVVANQVPDFAEALIDVRLMPGTTLSDATAWFATAAAAVPNVEFEMLEGSEPVHNPTGAALDLFCQVTSEVGGQTLTPMLSHGSSDARFFIAHDIPVISAPPAGGGQHGDHEWVDLAGLESYYQIVRRFTKEWAGPEAKFTSAPSAHHRASRV